MKRWLFRLALAGTAVVWASLCPPGKAQAEALPGKSTVHIGLVNTLFRGTSDALIRVLSRPLKTLMETQTGIAGELRGGGDPFELARLIDEKSVHLGVFHGFEYGWVRQQYPDLVPLVVPLNNCRVFHACLVVNNNSPLQTCAELKGKSIGMPYQCREHCRLFLERRCCGTGCKTEEFFRSVVATADGESALDDVFKGYQEVALIEKEDLDSYRKNSPVRYARLRVLLQSEPFPPGVIVYKKGVLPPETLKRFRDGLISANKSKRGRDLLEMCRLQGFEPVPSDFDKMLTDILKAYPAPAK